MSGLYIVSGMITMGLMAYLVVALVKPEWFE